jgi:YbbR domain-containing protein
MEKLVQQILAYLNTIPRPKNWVLKLISFFFALFLWYFVAGEDKVDMNVFIPIEIVNMPRDLVISNQFKKQLEVTVSGQRSLIRGLSDQNISRSVDLSHAKPGKFVIDNTPDSIPFPWGINVLRLQPSTVTLLIDRLIDKQLPVKPVITGSPAPGYELNSVVLEPSTITITGPKNVLDAEQGLMTNPIDITNMKETTLKQVSLDLAPIINDLIGETVVTAHINITEKMLDRLINSIPIELSPEEAEKYGPPSTTITVRAGIPNSLIAGTKDLNKLFRASVDPQPVAAGTHEFAVRVTISPEAETYKDKIRIIGFTPQTVQLPNLESHGMVLEGRKLKIRVNKNTPATE